MMCACAWAVPCLFVGIACWLGEEPTHCPQPSTNSRSHAWCESIPASERKLFAAALDGALAMYTSGRWSELYDVMKVERGTTREMFIGAMRTLDALVEFRPVSVTKSSRGGYWTIRGCAQFRDHLGASSRLASRMHAYHLGGKWLFDRIVIEVTQGGTPDPNPCSP